MAGIGFELKKLIDEGTYLDDFKAYFFAGMISAGPWMISIFCLGMLWMFSTPYMWLESQKLFRVTVVYTYAYSLITTGALQLIVTRFLADRLFMKQRNIFLPTYAGLMLLTIAVQGITATIFYSFCDVPLQFKIVGIVLYIAVSCIWQTMIFLSAARDFVSIAASFFFGNLASFVLALAFGSAYGFNGHLLGFTIGQVVVLMLLMYRIFCEFDSAVDCSFDFLLQMGKYFDLLLIGIFYYLAIWVDKLIYWYAPTGEHIKSLFYSNYPYDSAMFLAFLTIIPALAHFMVDVETNFYDKYKGFYGAIVGKGSLGEIRTQKAGMKKTLMDATWRMVLLQTLVTGTYLFCAPMLIDFLHLRPEHLYVLRMAGIGAFFHVMLMVTLILILYFDRRLAAMAVALCFLATNTSFTFWVINRSPDLMGLGYAAAAFVSFLFGVGILCFSVRDIEYLTFTGQPLVTPRLPSEASE